MVRDHLGRLLRGGDLLWLAACQEARPMSVPEEAGKVATGAIDALKGNPICLAVLILAGIYTAASFFLLEHQRERQAEREKSLIERCFPLTGRDKI
jgi:hypothetical protein